MIFNMSICLSDIPKEAIKVSKKNGKMYVNISAAQRREPDQYGKDVSVWVSQTKEQQDARQDRQYCGGGKSYQFEQSKPVEEHPYAPQPVQPGLPPEEIDDLPF